MAQNSYNQLFITLAFIGAILIPGGVSATAAGRTDDDKINGVEAWGAEGVKAHGAIHQLILEALGRYAVLVHNLHANKKIVFEKVIKHDDLPGFTHRLTIAATEGGISKTYEAIVFGKPWLQISKLISFKISDKGV